MDDELERIRNAVIAGKGDQAVAFVQQALNAGFAPGRIMRRISDAAMDVWAKNMPRGNFSSLR